MYSRILLLSLLSAFFCQQPLSAQISFSNRTDLLSRPQHFSGVAIGVCDMNGDGRDDIVRMNQGFQLAIEYQQGPNGAFSLAILPDVSNQSQWGMCVGDIDNNGYPDVLAGGFYDGVKIVQANADGTNYSMTTLNNPSTFVQCVNFADINNDGWLDAFVCHDDGASRIFANDGQGNFVYTPSWMDLNTMPTSDNSGNYGSVWSDVDNDGDLDLYIAKCRQGVNSPADGRRINQLFWNNGDGTYTQDTADYANLRIGAQSWTADFGDIDNDGDFDCFITNHDVKSQLLENDGTGKFTDISITSGVQAIGGLPIQGVFRDLDNDGYLDIIVAGSEHYILRNNGDKTFTEVPNVFNNNQMESFAIGDLNSDGYLDVYGGYAEIYTDPSNIPDVLWMNDGGTRNFFGLNLRGTQSNRSAVGAKVTLHTALGLQVREVKAGESYGIMNSLQIHFGLDTLTAIDSVRVLWPSGQTDVVYQPAINQYLNLEEGGCSLPAISINALGATTFCTGDSVQLEAPQGYNYAWSTGDTTRVVSVDNAGSYWVVVTDPNGCSATSNAIAITLDPVETPFLEALGDTIFCQGGEVVLQSSPASGYLWSTGDTTQSITVSGPGSYTVSAQGLCAWFDSQPIAVSVLSSDLSLVQGDTTWLDGTATLVAAGDSTAWYDAPDGNWLHSGDTLLTLPLSETTTYWVRNFANYDQPNANAGMTYHQGSTFAGNQFNGAIIFDCFSPVILKSVKVYTNKAGIRKIDLLDDTGAVLQSVTADIPLDTSVVELNFQIPTGADLVLTTDQSVNQANLNTVSPQLRRSDEGIQYPYEVPGVLSLKSSNFGTDRYYYFFNWELEFPSVTCVSDYVPVQAVVDSLLVGTAAPGGMPSSLRIRPNPSQGEALLELVAPASDAVLCQVFSAEGVPVLSRRISLRAGANLIPLDLTGRPQGIYRVVLTGADYTLHRNLVLLR